MIREFRGQWPTIAGTAFVAPGAHVIGRVMLGEGASVWFNAVLRGDGDAITLGDRSNAQDNVVIHADPGFPAIIGKGVSIGHGAVVHGCTVDDDCLIGMNATVLNGAHVGAGSLIAAGAVVREGAVIPPRSLVAGVPGRVVRELGDDDVAHLVRNADVYVELAAEHGAEE